MTQNLLSLNFTAADIAEIDAALATLEKHFQALIELSVDDRQSLAKMGDKSEVFCRQALVVLDQNRHILPASVDIDEATRDFASLDLLRLRFSRLRQLITRAEDTEIALGSDIYTTILEGYAIAKVAGKGAALDELRANASVRFAGQGRRKVQKETSSA